MVIENNSNTREALNWLKTNERISRASLYV